MNATDTGRQHKDVIVRRLNKLELRLTLDEPPGVPSATASGTLCAARVVVAERAALDWLGLR